MKETYSTRQPEEVVAFLVKKVLKVEDMPRCRATNVVTCVLDLVERSGALTDDLVSCTECGYLATENDVDSEGRCEDCWGDE